MSVPDATRAAEAELSAIIKSVLAYVPIWDCNTVARELLAAGWAPTTGCHCQCGGNIHGPDIDDTPGPDRPLITDWVLTAIAERRKDAEFMARVQAAVEQHRPILDRLADDPTPPSGNTDNDALTDVAVDRILDDDVLLFEWLAAHPHQIRHAVRLGYAAARADLAAARTQLATQAATITRYEAAMERHLRDADAARTQLAAVEVRIEALAQLWDATPLGADFAADVRALAAVPDSKGEQP